MAICASKEKSLQLATGIHLHGGYTRSLKASLRLYQQSFDRFLKRLKPVVDEMRMSRGLYGRVSRSRIDHTDAVVFVSVWQLSTDGETNASAGARSTVVVVQRRRFLLGDAQRVLGKQQWRRVGRDRCGLHQGSDWPQIRRTSAARLHRDAGSSTSTNWWWWRWWCCGHSKRDGATATGNIQRIVHSSRVQREKNGQSYRHPRATPATAAGSTAAYRVTGYRHSH